jgi:hypothetical protein
MKILDTKKSKEQREVKKTKQEVIDELHEYEEWLKTVSNTAPPNLEDLKGLFDGFTTTTLSSNEIKSLVDIFT